MNFYLFYPSRHSSDRLLFSFFFLCFLAFSPLQASEEWISLSSDEFFYSLSLDEYIEEEGRVTEEEQKEQTSTRSDIVPKETSESTPLPPPKPYKVPSEYDEVVSLGNKCQVAGNIRFNNMRKNAYPFDWNVTSFTGIIKFIATKGEHFLDKDQLVNMTVFKGSHHFVVRELTYDFILPHDFLVPHFLKDYDLVKAKYSKRMKRFFDLLESNKRVLFIRLGITREQAEYLDYILSTHYPNLHYTLLVLNHTEDFKEDWKLDRIRNYYITDDGKSWKGDTERWKQILSRFRVTPSEGPPPDDKYW